MADPRMTPARRAWLERLEREEQGEKMYGLPSWVGEAADLCRHYGWTERFTDRLTPAGREALAKAREGE